MPSCHSFVFWLYDVYIKRIFWWCFTVAVRKHCVHCNNEFVYDRVHSYVHLKEKKPWCALFKTTLSHISFNLTCTKKIFPSQHSSYCYEIVHIECAGPWTKILQDIKCVGLCYTTWNVPDYQLKWQEVESTLVWEIIISRRICACVLCVCTMNRYNNSYCLQKKSGVVQYWHEMTSFQLLCILYCS